MGESTENNTAGFADALKFWQGNQLRILVVASLVIQWLLFVCAPFRQHRIPGLLRLFIWLAYLGSDAVAIYALATLFNSHRCDAGSSSSRPGVELLWAPIMLVHLGGQDSITAYNIEDNELWRRHVLTAVSQGFRFGLLVRSGFVAKLSNGACKSVFSGRWEGHLAPILPISGVGGHMSKLEQNMPLLKQRVAFLDIARICELFVLLAALALLLFIGVVNISCMIISTTLDEYTYEEAQEEDAFFGMS
ncbi:unnamed protein product [Miscanthus lutarioriparius]|uniref:DUF4220 domain-containing protein n=1 Tax=Miscanthus lutarioriparius TaxID=422564 RepID=A0A811QE69_9POAL|nr:unnamed protein product [Miscanthus lutarioriparius]